MSAASFCVGFSVNDEIHLGQSGKKKRLSLQEVIYSFLLVWTFSSASNSEARFELKDEKVEQTKQYV